MLGIIEAYIDPLGDFQRHLLRLLRLAVKHDLSRHALIVRVPAKQRYPLVVKRDCAFLAGAYEFKRSPTEVFEKKATGAPPTSFLIKGSN